ncbi:MAG: hypothetical protein WC888_06200, partial [Candidatus Izemoplasmatales bacterium]
NEGEKRACQTENIESWDEAEYYHVFETIVSRIANHLAISFVKLAFCAGVIIVENYHECTLHPDELLIKY